MYAKQKTKKKKKKKRNEITQETLLQPQFFKAENERLKTSKKKTIKQEDRVFRSK